MPVSPTPDESYYWEIAQAYQQAELAILSQIRDRLDKGQELSDQKWLTSRLAEVQTMRRDATKVLASVNSSMASKISGSFGNAYKDGELSALKDTAAYLPDKPSAVSSRTRQNVVAALARQNTQKIAGVLPGMLRQLEDDYLSVVKTAVKSVAAGGTNDRRKATAQALQQAFGKGLKTGPGGKMNLPDYVQMAVRTGTANAMIQGHLDTLGENGLNLVMIYPGPRHCDRCDAWSNTPLYRTSGKPGVHLFDSAVSTNKVKVNVAGSLNDAKADGWGHPNCRCNVGVFLPGVTPIQNPRPKWDEEGYKNQQAQRAIERKIREWKTREALATDPAERVAAHNKVTGHQALLRSHLDAHPELKRKRINEQITGLTGPDTITKPKVTPPKAPSTPSKAEQIAKIDQEIKDLESAKYTDLNEHLKSIDKKLALEKEKLKLLNDLTKMEEQKAVPEPEPLKPKPATDKTNPESPFELWLRAEQAKGAFPKGSMNLLTNPKSMMTDKGFELAKLYGDNVIDFDTYQAGMAALKDSPPPVASAGLPPKTDALAEWAEKMLKDYGYYLNKPGTKAKKLFDKAKLGDEQAAKDLTMDLGIGNWNEWKNAKAGAVPAPSGSTGFKPAPPTAQTFEQWVKAAESSPGDFPSNVISALKTAQKYDNFYFVQHLHDQGFLSKGQFDAAKKAWDTTHGKPAPEPAKPSPVTPKPSPVPKDTPSHPYSWDGKDKPVGPKEPTMPKTSYGKLSDDWINEAKAKYEEFAPGKKLENSNNWPYFAKVVNDKDASALQYLLDNQYIDAGMYNRMLQNWATGDKLTPAQAKKYKADMEKYARDQAQYLADLAAWKIANGVTSSSKGFEGAIRWDTDQAGVDWANNNLKVAAGDQRRAVQNYTGSSYAPWNEDLRKNNSKNPPTEGRFQKATRDADAAMAPTPADIIVHRGTSFHELSGTGANMPPPAPTSLIGKTYTNPGYMSTSVGKSAAFGGKPVQMEILVPEGYGTSWAMPYSNFAGERELLLSRHSTIYIHDVYESGGRWRVVAEIVPDGEDVSVWSPAPPARR
ncbi:capsid maturation protease and VIP2-like ADP-ribosyltransferase toxin [Microbacterium phage FireCastle]